MSQRKREEARLERIIRGLLKLPENKRCINCNQLGPQYVCTTFLTFVCTTCSGVHREFSHRVKSVSMARFNSDEVTALQAAGNERARQIYLKAWDPDRNTHPDGSNIHRIRDFIKHVYVDRRYTGGRSFDPHTMAKLGQKGSFYEKDFIEKSGLSSRDDFYERRYHERSSPSGRSDRGHRNYIDEKNIRTYIDGKDYRNCIEGRSPDSIYERYGTRRSRSVARFEIGDTWNQNDKYGIRSQSFRTSSSDTSMSLEPQRIREKAGNMTPESHRITEKASLPVLRPLKDIMGENPPTLKIIDRPKANKVKDANDAACDQKKSSSDSHGSTNVKEDDYKAASASGLIQNNNKSESPDTCTIAKTESGFSIQSSTAQKNYNPPNVNSVEFLLLELSGLPIGNASENPSSIAASLTAPATLPASAVDSSTKPVASSILPTDSSTSLTSSAVPKASSSELVTSPTNAAATESALTPRTSATPTGKAAVASSSVGNAQNHLFSGVYPESQVAEENKIQTTQQQKPSASPAGTKICSSPQGAPTFEASTPAAFSAVPKASSTEPVTSPTAAATTESALTPRTSENPAREAAVASSSVVNAQNHPFTSVYPVSRVSEENKVQTTQLYELSASSAGTNTGTSPQGAPTFEAFFDQPRPSLPASTAQKAPGSASADQSSQAVSKAAQTTTSPRNESKSSGRRELPAELFTFSHPAYSAPIKNWQIHPPNGLEYGMQYAPSPNVTAFPGSAKSRNPFDLGEDSRPVQGVMLSSIASFPGEIPQMSPQAGVPPQPSPFASALPPELPSYGTYMSPGGYVGQQLPNNMPNPRPQGTGSFGGNDDGNTGFASLDPIQHSTSSYSSNLIAIASNSFSSAGRNPFA